MGISLEAETRWYLAAVSHMKSFRVSSLPCQRPGSGLCRGAAPWSRSIRLEHHEEAEVVL